MASKDGDVNAYEVLEIDTEANEADIRKAYRQRSLKVHPDRVSIIDSLCMFSSFNA
jgi:DnaJ homolog subfamily C member 17